jgi:hypothetical protein
MINLHGMTIVTTCLAVIVFLLTITALKMGLFGEVKDQDKNEIDLVGATDLLNAKNRRIAELKDVLKLAREDLLMRAQEDSNGLKVIGLDSAIWAELNEELKE